MNASKCMDKQIMDLSRSKSDLNSNDFIDLMNPQSEEDSDGGSSSLKKKEEILASYDFQPIHRPVVGISSDPPASNAGSPSSVARAWNSLDSKANSSPVRSYSSLDPVEPDKIILDKAQKVNDSQILLEIDRTMKKYTDSLLHAIDALSARMSQLESRTRHLEYSVDDLKVSIGNNHGSFDGKMRQLENILMEVQTGVQNIKDKQDVMEGHMQLSKLQISKVDQSSETSSNAASIQQLDHPVQQASAPPQLSNLQHFPISLPPSLPSLPPNGPPPSQQTIHPSPPVTGQFPPPQIPPGPHRDAYFPPPGPTKEAPPPAQHQQYQVPPPPQHQLTPAPQPQQYQPAPTLPYPQPPQPQFQPQLGHHPEESPYINPAQTYPPNLRQPTSHPNSGAPPHSQSQQYYGYGPPSGPPSEPPYPYSGPPPSHYARDTPVKPQPHSPGRGGSGNYPQIPTARILPQAIPTAAGISDGSSSGGSGNRVPIDDVVDKVTNMGFPREVVRATVRKLTENGQSVDLNIVLDKLMNDGEIQQPQRGGWFGR